MTKTIKVHEKCVFGNDLLYPVCETAQLFCQLADSKTVTGHITRVIKAYGYTIERV